MSTTSSLLSLNQRIQEDLVSSHLVKHLFILKQLVSPHNMVSLSLSLCCPSRLLITPPTGARPTLSSMCLKCPLVVTVLSKFALDYDPNFTFTTVTINYNYASAPHQDVNHEDGRARIIAFGDFQGGELNLEGVGDVEIRNRWYDFDGTILHSTNPFIGERYSLVYFTHVSWRSEAEEIGRKLISLGVPWPATISPATVPSLLEELIDDRRSSRESAEPSCCSYYFLPLKKRHQYETAIASEISSMCSLYLQCHSYELFPPIKSPLSEGNSALAYGLSIGDVDSSVMNAISDRAVTFTVWKKICSARSLESLFQSQVDSGWTAPQKFGIEIYSPGKQMSTRQKRKVLLLAQLSRPSSNGIGQEKDDCEESHVRHYQLCLLLEFDWSQTDADGSQGSLSYVHLCEQITPSNTAQSDLTKQKKKQPSIVEQKTLSDTHHDTSLENLASTSSTALRPVLSQLLCNLAKITKYSLVYDPFCGSRSILKVAEELGGYCLGSDAFEKQFSLAPDDQGNTFLSNIYHQQVIGRGQFDAIICDPPYGRREKHVDEKGIDFANHQTSDERALSQFKILTPLMELSSTSLKIGGRLVFLFLK